MSSFCGLVGKTDKFIADKMIKSLVKNCENTPESFDDGFIRMGFLPFRSTEEKQFSHNPDFTVWAMVDCGYVSEKFSSENLIEQYEKKGIAFLKELEGTYSIALWDGICKKLYLARDPFGSKPLYYAKYGEGIAFSTEISPLLSCDKITKDICYGALYQYMSFGSVYPKDTVFEQIKSVSPGCCCIYGNGVCEEVEFCDIFFGETIEEPMQGATDEVEKLLRNSVEKCVAGEKNGIFLSGGLDSSLVAALAPEGMIEEAFCLHPWTAKGSIHKKEEDVYYSELLAKKYGMKYHLIDMTPQDLLESMDEVIGAFSQPFSGTVSTYFLAKQASGICKRIVTGDGADELFGSYRHHMITVPMERYAKIRGQKGSVLLHEREFKTSGESAAFWENMYQFGGADDTLWYYRLLTMGDAEKGLFLDADRFSEYIKNEKTLNTCILWDKNLKSTGALNRSLERDFKHLLPGHTMLYQDTLSRFFGMNLTMPFMNKELVNYVVTLPQEYKIKDGITKVILRQVGKNLLPEEIVKRRKEPFTLPVNEWILTELKEFVTDILSEDMVRKYGLLNADCVQYALREFYSYPESKAYYAGMLWTMAMLQKWAMLYI